MHYHEDVNTRTLKKVICRTWTRPPMIIQLIAVVMLVFCFISVPHVDAKSFSAMTNMAATRYGHTVTALPNGLVMIAGGYNNTDSLKTVEIYNPETGTITPARNMNSARMDHTATLLANGQVLIAGGRNGSVAVNTIEIYNPATGTFTTEPTTSLGRVGHSATLLPNGKVLIAGGGNNNKYVATAELYDPEMRNVSAISSIVTPRNGHTATLMPNGKVLLVGGINGTAYITTAEVFDPITGVFSAVGQLNTSRFAHTASLLEDGRLLIAGGRNESGIVNSSEIFDPVTGIFTATETMSSARADHTSSLMPDGTVLIAGGRNALGYLNTAEVYDPEIGTFTPTSNMTSIRDISSANLLPNGKVLLAGGWDGVSAASSAELFDPELIQAKYRLLLNTVGKGEGSVNFAPGRNCSGGCSQFFSGGTTVRLTPVLDSASVFLGWSGCDSVEAADCIVTMSKNRLVKLKTTDSEADNNDSEYAVSATAGPNGSITPAGTTMVGRRLNITYTITPATGYHVAEVLVDGHNDLGAITTFTFTDVKKPHAITATFALNNAVTITASTGSNGTISPTGQMVMPLGTNQSYTITPDPGFKVADVLVDNLSVGAVSSYVFNDVTADHTISASFTTSIYTITSTAGSNGSIDPTGVSNINHGTGQNYTITPAMGFKVEQVLVDGIPVGAVTSYNFSNVTTTHTISATFTPIVYVITASAGGNGSINPAGPVNVNSGAGQTYTISAAPNFKVADVMVDNVSVGAVTSYSFTNVMVNRTISATFTPIVYVITASAGANGSINPAGPSNVNSGAGQSYTITAAPNFKLADVLVDGVSVGAVTSYSFSNVTANHTISASFTPIVYVITASAGANGSINPAGPSNVNSGAGQSYTFSAAPNYKVADVLVDGVSVGAVTSYTFFNVTASRTISVTFTPIVYVVTVTVGANGTIDPAGLSNVNSGANQTYTIKPDPGFKVADVLVDNITVGVVTTYSIDNVMAPHTISATFTPIVYVVTASAGANGSIDPAGPVNVNSGAGQSHTISAAPNFKIADVLVDGVSVGAVTSYSFTNVTANHTINASFAPIVYVVTASAGANGSIDPAGPSNVNSGAGLLYAISAAPNFRVADVLVDGVSVGAITSYSFSNVTANRTISASFTPIVYVITASAGVNGSINPAGPVNVNSGAGQPYTISAAPNFKVADVLVDGVSIGAMTSYNFTNVTTNHTISASFTPIVYVITASSGVNGSINPVGTTNVNSGANLLFTITPTHGSTPGDSYKIADVLVDGVSVGAVASYTFSSVSASHGITASFTPLEVSLDYFIVTATAGAGGNISSGGDAVLFPGENSPTYEITPLTGFQIAQVFVDGQPKGNITRYSFNGVTANHTITATFTPLTFNLIATAVGNGGIDPAGLTSVNYGANQSYIITPAAGFKVADVLVDGVSVGKVASYSFTSVTAGHTLAASFTPITYDLTATAGANGTVDPVGVSTVNSGASKTYSITPATGYKVADVLVDGVSAGKLTSYTFSTITANHSISASFEPLVVNVDYFVITATPPTNGTITPAGTTNVLKGSDSPLYTVTPATGYVIVSVGDNGVQIGKRPSAPFTYTFTNVTKAHTLSATFQLATYTITPVAGANGSMSPAYPVTPTYGASQYCSFTPSAGYHVADVLIDGVSIGALPNYTFTNISAPHTIEVQFAANASVTITASAGDNGTINPAGVTTVLSGSNQAYTITPSGGYRVADVLVDGVSKGAVTSYTFSKISSSNHTISVTFTLDVYAITASTGANGTIDPIGTTTNIAPGSTLSYTITPAVGYKVSSVIVDGSSKGNVSSYTFAAIMANHTISVTFTPITYTITQSAGAGGTNYPNTVAYIVSGQNATYTIAPDAGYHVADVLVDGLSVGAVASYTFTNVTKDHTIVSSFTENPTIIITATAGPNGSISPSGDVAVVAGKNMPFMMTPAPAYRVADVVVDGISKGALTSYTFTNVSATNHTINVTFMLDTYTIRTSAGLGGSINPAADVIVAKGGNSPTYTVTPSTGYVIVSVGDNGKQLARDPSAPYTYSFVNVTADHTLSATFRLATYTITPISGANGSITPAYPVFPTYGASQYCSFAPSAGYHVADVLIDGVSIGVAPNYTFTNISATHTIEVQFAANPSVTITASAGANGTVDPAGVNTVFSGSSQTYTMFPAAGYRVADVVVDGVSKGAVTSYTFTKITEASHTISVIFTLDVYTIIATSEANGLIDPVGTTTVNGGDSITYTITPAAGYKVLNVAVDGIYVGAMTTYTFANVLGNHTINPSFALIQ
jgi:ABC-type transporter MlaC component